MSRSNPDRRIRAIAAALAALLTLCLVSGQQPKAAHAEQQGPRHAWSGAVANEPRPVCPFGQEIHTDGEPAITALTLVCRNLRGVTLIFNVSDTVFWLRGSAGPSAGSFDLYNVSLESSLFRHISRVDQTGRPVLLPGESVYLAQSGSEWRIDYGLTAARAAQSAMVEYFRSKGAGALKAIYTQHSRVRAAIRACTEAAYDLANQRREARAQAGLDARELFDATTGIARRGGDCARLWAAAKNELKKAGISIAEPRSIQAFGTDAEYADSIDSALDAAGRAAKYLGRFV